MRSSPLDELPIPIAGLAAFGVAGALVGVRGVVHPEVTALVLAATVVLFGRIGGRAAGVSAAVFAALSFDFLHTRPYLSLKIANANDLLITALLLVVGIVVGGMAGTGRAQSGGLQRVLDVARHGQPEDVHLTVRAELLGLLGLRDCWFTTDPVPLPVLGARGELVTSRLRYTRDGFELPRDGIAIEVAAFGRTHGYLICYPTAGVGATPEARRAAVELANVLGIAMSDAA